MTAIFAALQMKYPQLQQDACCERTQHKINRSGVGSKPPFAANYINVR